MGITPKQTGPWDIASLIVEETDSVLSAHRLLPGPPAGAAYELFSLRMTISEPGTGNLASGGICDGPVNVGLTNTDRTGMALRREQISGEIRPNTYWHWGRSAQKPTQGDATIYLPGGFYWNDHLWGWTQNAAGATVGFLFTVVFRLAWFSRSDFVISQNQFLPGIATKDRIAV